AREAGPRAARWPGGRGGAGWVAPGPSGRGPQRAEQAVPLVVRPGGEVEGPRVARGGGAEGQAPQAVDLDPLAVGVPQLAEEGARGGVVGADAAAVEVPHQQGAPELAEVAGRQ